MKHEYQFTDTELAAQRLDYLARVYEPCTRKFLSDAIKHPPDLVIDLGYGPGHTTVLLSECSNAQCTVGLDNSDRFVELAEVSRTDRVSFAHHDVTAVPFPVSPAQLIFCRYLLSHLPDVEKTISFSTLHN